MSAFLPDVNVLVAILDQSHVFHEACTEWFIALRGRPWLTCPIVENGVVRVLSSPSYPGGGITPVEAVRLLRDLVKVDGHKFVPDDISIADPKRISEAQILGSKLVTDVYLIGLCRKHGAKLATTDQRLMNSVPQTSEFIVAI